MKAFTDLSVTRIRGGQRSAAQDSVAVELPLEIRLHGRPYAVVMRTPGADRELAAGFLLSERVIQTPDDLGAIEFCTEQYVASGFSRTPDEPRRRAVRLPDATHAPDATHKTLENVVNVTLAGAAADEVESRLAERRDVMASAACGVCGRVTIDTLRRGLTALTSAWTVETALLISLSSRLREVQTTFAVTGGLHAAGLFSRSGLVVSAEDVGRHNAVDKVVGRMLMTEQLPLDGHVLFVSGRTSFEIVQKAWCAGIPIVAAVSAPSSLAVSLAEAAGITLVGFARDEGFNIYAHAARIAG
jgi:FdhD protein